VTDSAGGGTVPVPPEDPAALDVLPAVWPAGRPLFRGCGLRHGPLDFYAGDAERRGRFHPIPTPGGVGVGVGVPVLYAAQSTAGALSESVFHDVPVRGTKRVPYAKLAQRQLVELDATRDLHLADLTSDGLSRLGVSRLELIESDADQYPRTAAWARALHAHPGRFDGLLWVSRQQDTSLAVVLFGDRVTAEEVRLTPGGLFAPLLMGVGLELACEAANRAGITITGLPA